jgi:hypothetical protein
VLRLGGEATMTGSARGRVADNGPASSRVSSGMTKCFTMVQRMQEIAGQPWEYRGGILVGFLELGDGGHAAPQLLQS